MSEIKRRSYRVNLTVDHEMTVALEILAAKSGLSLATQAMVTLRQGLYQTIQSEACQLRIRQDRAYQTRDAWLADRQAEAYVANAVAVAQGDADDAPPA